MKTPRNKDVSKRLGSALVMTLVIIVLITVVTVGYLASVMLETKTAGASLDQERAYGVAMIGVHEAMSRVRDALGPWDDPYKNFATNTPPFYWSISPGRITRWSYASLNPQTNFALFSESSGTSLVNLNRPLADGTYPIIGQTNVGETSPPDVSVKWANVLRDPSQTASSTNAIIGRYAFWVDDEGAKININTADGTEKYTTNSLGVGSPSEVSLEVLFGGTNGGGTNGRLASKEIVQIARKTGFRSPQEILSATNVTSGAYTNNVFSLTTYSRSPDLNVFGQPKMALLPMIGDGDDSSTNMALNGITLRPPTEIYPTPSQLPGYVVKNRYLNEITNRSWPLAFRQNRTDFTTGRNDPDYYSIRRTSTHVDNYCYVNGWMLANYLAGTNAAGNPVTWPAFPGPSGPLTGGFAGKYTPRQIDNIVAQIVSLGSKAISSDIPYSSGNTSLILEQKGMRYNVVPYMFPGWLSDELVIGMGRSMKLTSMLVKVSAFGSQTNTTPPVPKARLDIWLEWWVPGAYRGGKPLLPIGGEAKIINGHPGFSGGLNEKDLSATLNPGPGHSFPGPPDYNYLAAVLPRSDYVTKNYWGNQMLTNNQYIDFAANPSVRYDPDQKMAQDFHDPWAKDVSGTKYMGGGSGSTLETGLNDTPFRMHDLQDAALTTVEWKPGEMRSNKNRIGINVRYPMQKDASGNLVIGGGIAIRSQIKYGGMSEPEPVPLDGARGPYRHGAQETNEPLESAYGPFDWFAKPEYWAIDAVPGKPSKGNLYNRILDAVIPVNVTVGIPAPESSGPNVKFVLATVKGKDPLVNKFPGDWEVKEVPSLPALQFDDTYSGQEAFYKSYPEDQLLASMTAANVDSDSYWMPQADCALTQCDPTPGSDLAKQTLIFRSARMPNIGYLQYLRTGIIPDDEDKPYTEQEGVPFRLLSFAPSTEPSGGNPLAGQKTTLGSSQAYPDWALLDLLYIPSMLNSYGPGEDGGPYNALTNLSYFGTSGGATSGRINPNGAVIYTTDVNTPQPGVSRTTPLQAVLNGVMVNQKFNVTAANPEVWPYTGGDLVDSQGIAEGIEKYIRDKGPLRMPSEVCNVPEVAALRARVNSTRNDLVRQIVGNLTTQDNVFSVWTVGQSILKKKGSPNYGEFEAGDSVLAEVRLHFVVERYLDPGADGFYGNSVSKGDDNIAGTYDDPMDAVNHPFQPKYLYRVIASEEVR
jgi:hypothetical protein